jgi:signal transduction histidine kinase
VGEAVWLQRNYTDPTLTEFTDMLNLLRSQQPVWASANGDTSTLGSLSALEKVNARAMLGLPLVNQGKPIGFVILVDTERQRTFSEREIDLARAVVSQGSTALQNAHLLRELEISVQDLKTAQDRLVRGARLSAMGELAGAVAHQVNNPLTTIVLDAELLLMDSNLSPKSRESLDAILRSGKRAASVVRRLLTMTTVRPDSPHQTEEVNVIETIQETLSLIRAHVQRDGVQVVSRIDVHDEIPLTMAARDDLSDLWLNLLMNAHDALAGRSGAEMGADVVYQPGDSTLTVSIWDNGPGIPEEIRDRIFEPFFTTKPIGEGTGLGLHICRQIIDRIGGSIELDSSPQLGTQFVVRLPVVRSEIE